MNDHLEQCWNRVQKAREKGRMTARDYILALSQDFIELKGDRLFGDDPAIVGGIGTFAGQAVTWIGHQKGSTLEENIKRNFGMPNPEGYRKALRLMKQAEKFNRPIVTFIDTPGAYCGLGAEERGQGEAIARNLLEMSGLKVPIIAIVIGEGGSGGALALSVADRIMMLENAIYAVLSPEGFASILWKDASRAKEAAALMKITAQDLHRFTIVDEVIDETDAIIEVMKKSIEQQLHILQKMDVQTRLNLRYQKYRQMGSFSL